MKLKTILITMFFLILCSISVSALNISIYDIGSEWAVLNFTEQNQISLNATYNPSVYAEGYFHSYTTPAVVDLITEDVYYPITNYTIDDINGFTYNSSGLVTEIGGMYKLNFMFAVEGGNGGDYEFELHKNMIPQPDCSTFISTSTTLHRNVVITCLKKLEVNDTLMTFVKDISAPVQDISYLQLNMNILKISDLSEVECEISEDNIIFNNFKSLRYDGTIDEVNGLISILNLDIETDYYVRCRENVSEDWSYNSFKTEGGYNKMLVLYIALMVFAFAFLVLSRYSEEPLFFSLTSATLFVIAGLMILTTGIEDIASYYTQGIGLIGIAIGSFYYLEIAKNRKNHEG